jgi:hypothetical protein
MLSLPRPSAGGERAPGPSRRRQGPRSAQRLRGQGKSKGSSAQRTRQGEDALRPLPVEGRRTHARTAEGARRRRPSALPRTRGQERERVNRVTEGPPTAASPPRKRNVSPRPSLPRGPGSAMCAGCGAMSMDAQVSDAHQPRPRNWPAHLRKQGAPRPRGRPRLNEDPRSGP